MASQLRLALAVCLLCCFYSEGGLAGTAIVPRSEKPRDSSSALSEIHRMTKEFENKMLSSVMLHVQLRSKLNPPSRSRSWLQSDNPVASCSSCLDTNPLSPFSRCALPSYADLLYPLLNEPTLERVAPPPPPPPPPTPPVPPALDSEPPQTEVANATEESVELTTPVVEPQTVPEIFIEPANETEPCLSVVPVDTGDAVTLFTPQHDVTPAPPPAEESPSTDSPTPLNDQPPSSPPSPEPISSRAVLLPLISSPAAPPDLSAILSYTMAFALGAVTASLLWWAVLVAYRWMQSYPQQLMAWIHTRAQDLSTAGQHATLAAELRAALPRLRVWCGDTHRDTCACKHYLARALVHSERGEDRIVAAQLLEEVRQAYLPFGEDRHMALVWEDLGRARVCLGDDAAALPCLKTALRIFTEEHLAQRRDAAREDDRGPSQSVFAPDTPTHSPTSSVPLATDDDDDDDDWLHAPLASPHAGTRRTTAALSPQRLQTAMDELDGLLQSSTAADAWRLTRQTPLLRRPPHEVVDRDVARVCLAIGEALARGGNAAEAAVYLSRGEDMAARLCGEASREVQWVRRAREALLAGPREGRMRGVGKAAREGDDELSPNTVACASAERGASAEGAALRFPRVDHS